MILFGSFVKRKQHQYSDVDLAIISDQFANDPVESMMQLSRLTNEVSDYIEPIALASKDMEKKHNPLIGEINKYGKVVYVAPS